MSKPILVPRLIGAMTAITGACRIAERNEHTIETLTIQGRVVWSEDVIRSGVRMTFMHHLDLDTGIDEMSILDENGRYMTAVTTRYTRSSSTSRFASSRAHRLRS